MNIEGNMDKKLLEQATKYVNMFSESTNLECLLVDNRGKKIYSKEPETNSKCRVCSLMDKRLCEESHLFGAYQSSLYGGNYVFFCPIGLVHFASPIIQNQEMVGALLGGHLLMMPPDELAYEQIESKINISNHEFVKQELLNVPVVNPKRVTALSELLKTLSEKISDETAIFMKEKHEWYQFNQKLSIYIEQIKAYGKMDGLQKSYPVNKEKELLSFVKLGDQEKAKTLLNNILNQIIYLSGNNIELLKVRVLELIVLFSRATLEAGGDLKEILGHNYVYLNQINEIKGVDRLICWISNVMLRFMDCVFDLSEVKHINAIHKAMNLIKENYAERITLEDVARFVNFTPQYFSKIFKEETRYTFKNYVNKVRIENGKRLLLEGENTLSEIAYILGFSDQSHFSRYFKQLEGVSPSEYKNGKID